MQNGDRGFTEHHFGRSSSFSENAHNSWTPWHIHFKFCILIYFNIVRPLPCKTVTRLCRASFWPVKPLKSRVSFWLRSFSENAHLYAYVFKHCTAQWLVQTLVCKRSRGFTEHHFGWSSSFSENAHISSTPGYIWSKFCILMYFKMPCKTVGRSRVMHITVSWFQLILAISIFMGILNFMLTWAEHEESLITSGPVVCIRREQVAYNLCWLDEY